ncbi:MAG: DegT/DnrJ/EryC1/StrS family aminotransferase [Candidatus Omnitrophica bacterium]|nr:DegT/DnrJ/EryC1/StrS family aminotransferase [Candidatus Omnitrophota bacterium]
MRISALDLKRQIAPIRQELDMAIKDVIDSTSFILGKAVNTFEENVMKYCRVKYAIGVSNGTDAISLALLALGIKAGDGVICPAFTYYATAGAIASIGARPVFADIDSDTYCISLKSIEKVLKNKKKYKIKAIIPVHLYGQCSDMDGIMKLARKYNLKVVEDTAQAFGAEYKGRKAGTIGNCGSVSFFPGKNLGAFGDAGMILTNNKAAAERARILRNQGNKTKYIHLMLGRNNRMDGMQAAALNVKLRYLDDWNKKRQELAQYYNNNLSLFAVKTPFVAEYSTHIYHQYVLRIARSRDGMMNYLQKKGIDSRVFYPIPLHLQKCFRYLGYKRGDFPESEKAARQTLTLPIDPCLTQKERRYISQSLKEFING